MSLYALGNHTILEGRFISGMLAGMYLCKCCMQILVSCGRSVACFADAYRALRKFCATARLPRSWGRVRAAGVRLGRTLSRCIVTSVGVRLGRPGVRLG